jgi:hypothetical protein
MTANDFREMALAYPRAVESAHMNHPDFRSDGKIFATLGYADDNLGMVKLTPEQQRSFVRESPGVFNPCSGAWGLRGATNVHLASVERSVVRDALDCAFQNITAKARKKSGPGRSTNPFRNVP